MRKKPVPNLRAPAKTKPASQKRSREQPLPPAESQAATTGVTAAGPRATIRVYRHGLGDCILIQLKRAGGNDFKILIDCGVAVATQDAPSKMKKVLEDVVQSTKGKIDVLAVTHEHWDHVSGFSQAQDVLGRLDVGAVWVAWTEDETDDLAKSLRQQQDQAVAAVAASAQATAMAGDPDRAQGLLDVLGLLGAAGEKTKAALDIAKAKAPNGEKPRYWRPTDPPFQVPGTDIRIYALGPPHDLTLIRKILPSKSHPETYELALDGSGIFPLGVKSALDFSDQDVPFADRWMIPLEQARGVPFFQTRYWSPAWGEFRLAANYTPTGSASPTILPSHCRAPPTIPALSSPSSSRAAMCCCSQATRKSAIGFPGRVSNGRKEPAQTFSPARCSTRSGTMAATTPRCAKRASK